MQVNIALVVTRGGMPLGYEIFPGNTADVMTVEEIVEAMERRFGKAKRIWVMDRGMVSAENIAWLNETGRRYVIGAPRSELKRWARALADKTDWRRIREDVEVKICRGPEGDETFLLCRSAARIEKERAMHERFCKRIEARLETMTRRIAKSTRRLDPRVLERQIGRLLERNARAAARYVISIEDDQSSDSGLRLKWTAHPEWDQWASLSEGTYILRSNVHEWTDEELWKTYIQLTEAEAAFRIIKRQWLDQAWTLTLVPDVEQRVLPQFRRLIPGLRTDVQLADEIIEHVFWVIPEERRLTCDDAEHWLTLYARLVEDLPRSRDPEPRIRNGFRSWFVVSNLFPGTDIEAAARRTLEEWGLFRQARKHASDIAAAHPDKRRMVRTAARGQGLPPDLLELCRLDVKRRRIATVPF